MRLFLPNQGGKVTRRLPIHKYAVFNQRPALRRHALVVVTNGRQSVRLRPVRIEIANLRAELKFAGLVRGQEAGPGKIGLPEQRAIQLGGMADRLMNRQPEV